MNKQNRGNEGLTLIELLVTIAVIAIVAAISVPVITNVISSSRDNAAGSMEEQVNSFIEKYLKAGQVTYNSTTKTFAGFVDLDGNGVHGNTAEERIESLVVGSEFAVEGLIPAATTNILPANSAATVNSAGGSAGSAGGSPVIPARVVLTSATAGWDVLANGVTITCSGAQVGDSANLTIDGVATTVTKRTKSQIQSNKPLASTSCTSDITSMSFIFNLAYSFNDDISHWDTSSATTMFRMFYAAYAFNGNIESWNTSSVTNTGLMFTLASSFNGNIGTWNTSSMTDTSSMFQNATAFNGDISTWNVSNVTNMTSMFSGATSFNQNIGGWNTVGATIMINMFTNATSFNQDLSGWNVARPTVNHSPFATGTFGSWLLPKPNFQN